ncbi:MAG: hypothetical protein V1802_02995 [Candidatus Aenigmatarchaeota archaeon]
MPVRDSIKEVRKQEKRKYVLAAILIVLVIAAAVFIYTQPQLVRYLSGGGTGAYTNDISGDLNDASSDLDDLDSSLP